MDHHQIASQLKGLSLLYIEDDPEIQGYIAEFLGRYTSDLHLAQSAEEGMELYKSIQPDIILLDINLPGKSGLEFARELRRDDHSTRIIISTAYTDQDFLITAVELELTRYLIKPITSKELTEALLKALKENQVLKPLQTVDLGEGFSYEKQSKTLLHNKQKIDLRRKELQLLEYFISNSHRTLPYEVLQYEVWKDDPMSKDAIRAQIRNLRKKTHPKLISNINAVGYKFYEKGAE